MKLRVTVQGNTYDVDVEVLQDSNPTAGLGAPAAPSTPRRAAAAPAAAPVAAAPASAPAPSSGGAKTFNAPLAGTIRGISVKSGDQVKPNDELLVLEAMKMETSVASDRAGTVKAVLVSVGVGVKSGEALIEFE
jgi:biotin carboxyl carrier protein